MKLVTCFHGAVALLSVPGFGALGKATLWQNSISSLIDPSSWANTHSPQVTWSDWLAFELMPQNCYQQAENLGFNPADISAFGVAYSDGPNYSMEFLLALPCPYISDMVDLFGRLPVHEREWVQHVLAVPGGAAYTSNAVIVLQGAVDVPSVIQHETTHSLDRPDPVIVQYSDTFFWLNSIASDTCVPDSYSNTNNVEAHLATRQT